MGKKFNQFSPKIEDREVVRSKKEKVYPAQKAGWTSDDVDAAVMATAVATGAEITPHLNLKGEEDGTFRFSKDGVRLYPHVSFSGGKLLVRLDAPSGGTEGVIAAEFSVVGSSPKITGEAAIGKALDRILMFGGKTFRNGVEIKNKG